MYVHAFEGHIACDANTQGEVLVRPVHAGIPASRRVLDLTVSLLWAQTTQMFGPWSGVLSSCGAMSAPVDEPATRLGAGVASAMYGCNEHVTLILV